MWNAERSEAILLLDHLHMSTAVSLACERKLKLMSRGPYMMSKLMLKLCYQLPIDKVDNNNNLRFCNL